MTTPNKKHKSKKKTMMNPREMTAPEQGGKTSSTDAYNGDDKHGPLEEEFVEKERR
jgi:hypothetical protein